MRFEWAGAYFNVVDNVFHQMRLKHGFIWHLEVFQVWWKVIIHPSLIFRVLVTVAFWHRTIFKIAVEVNLPLQLPLNDAATFVPWHVYTTGNDGLLRIVMLEPQHFNLLGKKTIGLKASFSDHLKKGSPSLKLSSSCGWFFVSHRDTVLHSSGVGLNSSASPLFDFGEPPIRIFVLSSTLLSLTYFAINDHLNGVFCGKCSKANNSDFNWEEL